MIEAHGASLKNVVYIKEAQVDYQDNCGLVIVSGLNLDSKISKKQNNGAGKSLLFSIIPNIAYESTPLAAAKRSRKDIMGKGSVASFEIKGNDGHVYRIEQTPSKYVIYRDGEDLQARTLAIQREWIQKIFPISEDEFYSYVYLQSQRNLEFQVGTPRSRLAYITNVWRLDQYDVLRKYFEKRLSDVKAAQTEFDVLSNQLLGINKSLEKLNWSAEKQSQLDEASGIVKSLSDTVKSLQTKAAKLRAQKEQVDFYRKTKALLAKAKAKVKYSKAELKEQAQLLQQLEEYERDFAQYEKLTKRWTAKLKEIGDCEFGPVEAARLKSRRKKFDSLTEQLSEMKAAAKRHAELIAELSELPEVEAPQLSLFTKQARKAGRDAREMLDEELGILNSTLSLESLVHDHKDGECPTCQQKININKLQKSIKAAKRRKDEVRCMIKALKVNSERVRIENDLKTVGFDDSAYAELKSSAKSVFELVERLEGQEANARRRKEYQDELNSIKKPKPPKAKPSLTEQEIEEQAEFISEIKRLQERLSEFDEEPSAEGIDEKLVQLEKKLKRTEREYSEAFSVTVKLGNIRSEVKLLQKQAKELGSQLNRIKPLIEKRDMLKTLALAYSNKGLKLLAVNEILLQLEQNLNRFANFIFAEPFKFEVFSKDDGVHVNVDRGHNKVSDVRQLSGAESDSFRLLYMLSSLVMAEDSRRTNFVVLDEPDSHMDDATRNLFIERYIPFLRTLVPHVFLITPNSKHLYSNCDHLTVVKKNGISKVVKNV